MSNHTLIIAEAGVNHNGSVEMALELVEAAAKAGADIVKFQTFKADKLVSKKARKAAYQIENTGDCDDSQYEMLRRLELSEDDFRTISAACRQAGIGFMSTAFDSESVDMLKGFDMAYWKIPSGEITNLPLLRKIGGLGKRIILSTGMCSLAEVEAAVEALEQAGTERSKIIVLHCTTQYPAPYSSVNLRALRALERIGCGGVGYSDHTEGIEIALAAVACGAKVIEKHFTLDRNLEGPDHRASLEPDELERMVRGIRHVEEAIGTGVKAASESELPNVAVARKSIVASRAIKKGEVFTEDNITTKRPGTGLSPMLWDTVIGRTAHRDFDEEAEIELP